MTDDIDLYLKRVGYKVKANVHWPKVTWMFPPVDLPLTKLQTGYYYGVIAMSTDKQWQLRVYGGLFSEDKVSKILKLSMMNCGYSVWIIPKVNPTKDTIIEITDGFSPENRRKIDYFIPKGKREMVKQKVYKIIKAAVEELNSKVIIRGPLTPEMQQDDKYLTISSIIQSLGYHFKYSYHKETDPITNVYWIHSKSAIVARELVESSISLGHVLSNERTLHSKAGLCEDIVIVIKNQISGWPTIDDFEDSRRAFNNQALEHILNEGSPSEFPW